MKKYILIAFLALYANIDLIGQEKQLNDGNQLEKIYLQTDRDIYITGENIWFRADYILNGNPSGNELSKSLYIELVTPLGESVNKQKFAIENGVATGSYPIPEGLLTATYMLRAYTQFQRNYPLEHITTNLILVINPSVPLTGYDEKTRWDLLVYADEGLGSVDEKVSKFAIRVHPNIIDKVKKLEIVDQQSNHVAKLNVYENGLGLAEFITDDSSNYQVKAILTNKDTLYKQIPKWKNDVSIKTEISEDYHTVKLKVTDESTSNKYTIGVYDGFLVPHQFKEIKAEIGWQEFDLKESIHGSEIIYLILKDAEGILLVDAIYRPGNKFNKIKVTPSKKKYDTRSEAEVSFEAIDQNVESYTVSVVKKGSYNSERKLLPEFVIANPQLLPSFFKHRQLQHHGVQEQIQAALIIYENLIGLDPSLLKDTMSNESADYWMPETRGITIRGVVRNINSHKPEAACDVYVATIGNEPQLHVYRTNQNGEFISTLKHVAGIQNLFLCVNSENEDALEILVNSDFVNDYEAFYATPTILDTSMRNFIMDLYVNAQLEMYHKTEDTIQNLPNNYKPIRFPEPSASVLLDDYIALPTLRAVINEIVPFVKVQRKKQIFSLEVLDPVTNQTYGDPLILVDNLPVFDVNELISTNPELIERISVINSTYVYGEHMFRGIVFFETNTKNFAGIELPTSSTFLEFQAVEDVAAFIPGNKQTDTEHSGRVADFRNVLYWNHDVKIVDGNGACRYLTSDYEGVYEVIVRGVSKKGIVSLGTTSFEVKNK